MARKEQQLWPLSGASPQFRKQFIFGTGGGLGIGSSIPYGLICLIPQGFEPLQSDQVALSVPIHVGTPSAKLHVGKASPQADGVHDAWCVLA